MRERKGCIDEHSRTETVVSVVPDRRDITINWCDRERREGSE